MPVMVRGGAARARHGKKNGKGKSKSNRRRNQTDNDTSGDFITPESIGTARLDPATLLGPMPTPADCILDRILCKVNHLCKWTQQRLVLTKEALCFTVVGEENMRDKILLHEVRTCENESQHDGQL